MPKISERRDAPVELTVSSPDPRAAQRRPRLPGLPWLAAAIAGSAVVVVLGWACIAVLVGVGWLTASRLAPATVLETISQGWLGVHGVPFKLAGLTLTLVPLGISALLAAAMGVVANYATHQLSDDELARSPWRATLKVVAACTAAYAVGTLLVASLAGAPQDALPAGRGGLVIAAIGSALGAASGTRPSIPWLPAWTGHLPRSIAAGLVGFAALGAGGLALAIGTHGPQIAALQASVAPDAVGGVLLVMTYLAYLPTLLFWAASYVLSAGLTVGTGTLLTPTSATVGLLPGIPLAGALPVVPPVEGRLMMASGALAGIAAAVALCRRMAATEPARRWSWTWRSAVAGASAGLLWAGASWFSRGDLGTGRLVGMGPVFPALVAWAAGPATAGAALAGLVAAAIVRRRTDESEEPTVEIKREATPRPAQPAADASGDEPTQPMPFGLG